MIRKLIFLCLAIFSIFGLFAFRTNEDPIMALLKKLEEFAKKYPTEKVYLHLDKPYYVAGDDIWFKAYVTDWKTGELSPMSTILYVELINQSNKIEKKLRLPMQNGLTWGDFKLTDTLQEGNYRIRAYTQWMRNAGPNFFFDKTIKIGNAWNNNVFTNTQFSTIGKDSTRATILFADENGKPIVDKNINFSVGALKGRDKTNINGLIALNFPNTRGNITINLNIPKLGEVQKVISIKVSNPAIDIQFLPEGGNLVQGTKSKIAIKAIGTNGMGLKVKGKILDQNGTELNTFETSDLGLGIFFLIPEPNKTYTAKIEQNQIFPLPKVELSGYTIAFNHLDSTKFMATVTVSRNLQKKEKLTLVAQKNGFPYSVTKLNANTRTIEIIYEKEYLHQGITQFTLFSPDNMPICERLVFVNNDVNDINIDLKKLKPIYEKKEKINLSLFSYLNSKPVKASFSISVTNEDAVLPDLENESNIKANLLLTSDLVGYVEKPNSYFLNNDTKTSEALDHLMLTQGWRKIDWKLAEPVISHQVEKELRISGMITKSEVPLALSKVSLITNSDGMSIINTTSNNNGEFTFENLEFVDPTKFVIQARSETNKKDVKIDINSYPEQEVTESTNNLTTEVNINQSISNYIKKSSFYFDEQNKQGLLSKTILLKKVIVEGKKTNLAPNSKNLNGPGNADQVIDVTNIESTYRVDKFLRGRVMGVDIDATGVAISSKTITNKNFPGAKQADADPIRMRIILDGIEMGYDFVLSELFPESIESIEVLRSPAKLAVYGPNAQNGLFIITTKKGAPIYTAVKYAPGLTTFTPKGYYPSRTFYSPKYDVAPSDKPDFRTTVFWAPNLVTDEFGNIKFDYFNTDQPGNYRMVIEGIDIDGNIARKTYTYKVN